MSKGKSEVSSDFAKFYGRNLTAIEDAKKAENSMSSGPCPVGWEGKAIILEAIATVGKDKKDATGKTTPGNPRVEMKFSIVDDEKYSGKTFKKYWIFNDTANASSIDRFEWFLNACEAMGMPRSLRESHDSLDEVLNFFVESEMVLGVKCENDDYSRDKKAMLVTATMEAVDSSDSMVADTISEPAPEMAVGSKVKFLGNEWNVIAIAGDTATIERQDGERIRTRECPVTSLTLL